MMIPRLRFWDTTDSRYVHLISQIAADPNATGYCTRTWMEESARAGKTKAGILALVEDGVATVFCPVVLVKRLSAFGQGVIVLDSLPYGGLGGIFFDHALSQEERLQAL